MFSRVRIFQCTPVEQLLVRTQDYTLLALHNWFLTLLPGSE